MGDNFKNFANSVKALTWAEMDLVAKSIAEQIPHLIKAEKMDPHGIAQLLDETASDIEKMNEAIPTKSEG